MKASQAILHFLPGSSFAISGVDYSTLEWDQGNEHPKPTEQEFNQFISEFQAIYNKREKIKKLNSLFEQEMKDTVKAGYTQDEIDSWPEQIYQARLHQSDPTAPVPMLERIAVNRGITVAEMAYIVINKSIVYSQKSGDLIGKRRAIEALLDLNPQLDVEAEWQK